MQFVAIFREQQAAGESEQQLLANTGYLQTGNWKVKLKIIIDT